MTRVFLSQPAFDWFLARTWYSCVYHSPIDMSTIGASASEYFGAMIESYDSLIKRAVPRYEEMTQRLLEYLPPQAHKVLELGCGTGNLSLRLAAKYPQAAI